MDQISIGDFHIQRIPEIAGPLLPAVEFFPDLTMDMLREVRPLLPAGNLSEADEVILSFHSYVLKTERFTILVDACCGNHKDRPSRPAFSNLNTNFLGTLAASGVRPEEIDFVMCTHLHWDHVGWNTELVDGTWVPTFPNARYIMARKEYEHWDQLFATDAQNIHRQGFEDSVLPVMRADQAVLVEDDFEIDTGVWLEPCHGHTPGQVVVNLKSGSDCGVMTGDVIHHRIQLRYPHVSSIADTDPDQARETRTALMARHADTGNILFPAHFNAPSFGRINTARSHSGYDFSPG